MAGSCPSDARGKAEAENTFCLNMMRSSIMKDLDKDINKEARPPISGKHLIF